MLVGDGGQNGDPFGIGLCLELAAVETSKGFGRMGLPASSKKRLALSCNQDIIIQCNEIKFMNIIRERRNFAKVLVIRFYAYASVLSNYHFYFPTI